MGLSALGPWHARYLLIILSGATRVNIIKHLNVTVLNVLSFKHFVYV